MTRVLMVAAAVLALAWVGWALLLVLTARAMERAQQDEAVVAGHVVTQSVPIANHPELVKCPAPPNVPKDEQGWDWYCAKGTK